MQIMIFKNLAQLELNELLNNGEVTARTIAENWNEQWLILLQNTTNKNIYSSLSQLGTFLAVGTLLFFMVQWLKDVIYHEYSRPISSLIWPFIVVFLLANPGQANFLSNLTLGLRNFINTINQQIVTTANSEQVYQQALNMSVAEDIAGSLLRPCQALTGEQQSQCLVKATEKLDIFLLQYRNLYGDKVWITKLENKINQVKYDNGTLSETTFNALLGSTGQTIIKNVLISWQTAFQNLIEAIMLLIAALGPLAVGASLLPVAGKPIFAWLSGFLASGIAKISFNILAIITSAVIVNGPGQDPIAEPDLLWFMIFLGILAPILALIIAATANFVLFYAISNTTSWVREKI
ncbi:hypothetical protein [Gloeothece verrucosa]|uniref:NAD/NADP transhydrogenase beta subunit n=1 Tax=Gloeothece verrucosa (strain PCC 7822) TaxID=497965 RepID=E0UKU1_GLOV7|nr:hypothetical protein [Gloeothece verrucosa]ADN17571.1 conserved hypothetical protein [Gloeothece verrucosa PCC 7822]